MLRAPLILIVFLATASGAREVIHLRNGFDLDALSHTVQSGRYTLTTDAGTIEIPETDIASVALLPDPPVRALEAPNPIPAIARPKADLTELLRLAALSQGNAPEFVRFVRSVAQVESGMRQGAISPKGAVGLMQLMPATAKDLGVEPSDAGQNAKGGAQYLRTLLVRYNYDAVLALAAYNAGPAAVDKYRGLPPYRETQEYVRRVLRTYEAFSAAEKRSETTASLAH